jgi:uncharacterized protein
MDYVEIALLFAGALFAGALNSVAGGGTFIIFPMLIFTGVPPIAANATCTVAMWPASVASAIAYKPELVLHATNLKRWITVSLFGGIMGSVVLLKTPSEIFEFLIPWLLLFATLLFGLSPFLTRTVLPAIQTVNTRFPLTAAALAPYVQFFISFYGGYFGAGIGIMMLSLLACCGLHNMHEMNALKSIFAACINGMAVLIFVIGGAIYWPAAIIMLLGAILGGYYGAQFFKRFQSKHIRVFVLFVAVCITIWFFVKTYLL